MKLLHSAEDGRHAPRGPPSRRPARPPTRSRPRGAQRVVDVVEARKRQRSRRGGLVRCEIAHVRARHSPGARPAPPRRRARAGGARTAGTRSGPDGRGRRRRTGSWLRNGGSPSSRRRAGGREDAASRRRPRSGSILRVRPRARGRRRAGRRRSGRSASGRPRSATSRPSGPPRGRAPRSGRAGHETGSRAGREGGVERPGDRGEPGLVDLEQTDSGDPLAGPHRGARWRPPSACSTPARLCTTRSAGVLSGSPPSIPGGRRLAVGGRHDHRPLSRAARRGVVSAPGSSRSSSLPWGGGATASLQAASRAPASARASATFALSITRPRRGLRPSGRAWRRPSPGSSRAATYGRQ